MTAEGEERTSILKSIGVTYQMGALFGSMTLLENVRLPLEEYTNLPSDAMDLIARMKLKLVGLEAFRDYMPSELSGGMQKRAAIARAMALDPHDSLSRRAVGRTRPDHLRRTRPIDSGRRPQSRDYICRRHA